MAAQGDLEARNILIERNLRLVAHIMKKYYAQMSDQEDLISIGTIGLIKGITTFDKSKGARLATYAARCVENAILSPMRFGADPKNPAGTQKVPAGDFLWVLVALDQRIQQRELLNGGTVQRLQVPGCRVCVDPGHLPGQLLPVFQTLGEMGDQTDRDACTHKNTSLLDSLTDIVRTRF